MNGIQPCIHATEYALRLYARSWDHSSEANVLLPLRAFCGSKLAVLLALRSPEGAVWKQPSVETTLEAQHSEL